MAASRLPCVRIRPGSRTLPEQDREELMKRRSSLVAIVVALLTGISLVTLTAQRGATSETNAVRVAEERAAQPKPGPPIALSGGAPSIDALIDEFLDAVERKDFDAVHRLRVTKDEYLGIIVPGTVDKGQPPRQISEQPREFFWALTDRKSRYAADNIVEHFGGLLFTAHALRFSKGSSSYLWYTTYGQVRLDLRTPENPDVLHLRTGSIAEVDGRYKFLAFNWND